MSAALKVAAPGLFTTLQDRGRLGFQSLGMPVAGALDMLSLQIANALCGNPPDMAALELRYLGPSLLVEAESVRLALAGNAQADILAADGSVYPLSSWRSFTLKQGDTLRVGNTDAAVAYLAVAGGFDLPPFMGSLSTYTRAALGGFKGRALQAGDLLPLALPQAPAGGDRQVDDAAGLYGDGPIRVVLGPQQDRFTPDGIAAFLSGEYRVTQEADRMGIRLEGPAIAHTNSADIASEGIANGAVQVPGNGQPILLIADRQTTGGYTKIATVISADLPRLGGLKPGAALRFIQVGVAEAEAIRRRQQADLQALLADMRPAKPAGGLDLDALYRENLISGMVDAAQGGGA